MASLLCGELCGNASTDQEDMSLFICLPSVCLSLCLSVISI